MIKDKVIFGDFNDKLPDSQEGLKIVFSPTSTPLQQRWRNNGLSADFMAEYFASFFTGNDEATGGIDIEAEIKSVVSFIANELLENGMKFNDESSPFPISLQLQLYDDKLVFISTNSISNEAAERFQSLISELMTTDPSELYIRNLEMNALEAAPTSSGLGLLTMIQDYQAELSWKFETIPAEPEIMTVTTMVKLAI